MLSHLPQGVTNSDLIRAGKGDKLLLTGGTLIDGTGRAPTKRAAIVIEDGRITAVGPAADVQVPHGARMIDTGGRWMMPGLIDCHVHLNGEVTADAYRRYLTPEPGVKMLRAVVDAGRMLRAGFTTVRDAGLGGFGVTLRRAAADGLIDAPRILAAHVALTTTGGHGDWNIFPYEWVRSSTMRGQIVDGVDQCRQGVRKAFRDGADFIKVIASGGGVTNHAADLISHPEFSLEELQAMVDEAHRRGARLTAHSIGLESARLVVEAGVDSIEHGVFEPDSALLDRMAHQGVSLVPTLSIFKWVAESGRDIGVFEAGIEAAKDWIERQFRLIRSAEEAGVNVALGTDNSGKLPPGLNGREVELLCEAGLSRMAALQAGTLRAARVCGLDGELGTIEPGKLADVLVLTADPLLDPGALWRAGTVAAVVQAAAGGHP